MKTLFRIAIVALSLSFAGLWGCSSSNAPEVQTGSGVVETPRFPHVILADYNPKPAYVNEPIEIFFNELVGVSVKQVWDNGRAGRSITVQFDKPGDHEFQVISTDENGNTHTSRVHVRVIEKFSPRPRDAFKPNAAPSFSVDPENGLNVFFHGSSSNDPDGSIVSYNWDFDDGTGYNFEANPEHTYRVAGKYHVSLVVYDNEGLADTTSMILSISEDPAPAPIGKLVVTSSPDLAFLHLDDQFLGMTNGSYILPVGSYQLKVRKYGFHSKTVRVEVKANQETVVHFDLIQDMSENPGNNFRHIFGNVNNGQVGLLVTGGNNTDTGQSINDKGLYYIRIKVGFSNNSNQRDENAVWQFLNANNDLIQFGIFDNAQSEDGKVWIAFTSRVALSKNQVWELIGLLGHSVWVYEVQGSINGDFSDPFFQDDPDSTGAASQAIVRQNK